MANDFGYLRNIESFQELVSVVETCGRHYQPLEKSISLDKLRERLEKAQAGMRFITTNLATNQTAARSRKTLFYPLEETANRIIRAYEECGAEEDKIDSAHLYAWKLQNRRQSKTLPQEKEFSVNGTFNGSEDFCTYSQAVEHLDNLIAVLSADPVYSPSDRKLTCSELKKLSADLKQANEAVCKTLEPLEDARKQCLEMLFDDEKGLLRTARKVKRFVKENFGAGSMEYERVRKIKFTEMK